jgi:hypothetical protein
MAIISKMGGEQLMTSLKNVQQIDTLIFTRNICPFCPIGKDYYSAEITVNACLGEYYPEYIELTAALDKHDGAELTVEVV